jgi:hypothetical protein
MDDNPWTLGRKAKAFVLFGAILAGLVLYSFFDLLFLGLAREIRGTGPR